MGKVMTIHWNWGCPFSGKPICQPRPQLHKCIAIAGARTLPRAFLGQWLVRDELLSLCWLNIQLMSREVPRIVIDSDQVLRKNWCPPSWILFIVASHSKVPTGSVAKTSTHRCALDQQTQLLRGVGRWMAGPPHVMSSGWVQARLPGTDGWFWRETWNHMEPLGSSPCSHHTFVISDLFILGSQNWWHHRIDFLGPSHASSDAARLSVAMAPRSGSPFASPRPLRSPRTAEKAPLENWSFESGRWGSTLWQDSVCNIDEIDRTIEHPQRPSAAR